MTGVGRSSSCGRAALLAGAFAILGGAPAFGAATAPSPSYERGAEAYRAYARGDFAAAVVAARAAAQLAPADRGYQLLLMQSEAASGDLSAAEQTAASIEKSFGPTADLSAQRGFYALGLHRTSDAVDAFSRALSMGGMTPAQARTVRLGLSDALAGLGQPARALEALAPLADEPSYDVSSRRAQALLALPPSEGARVACEQAAKLAPGAEQRAYFTRSAILVAIKLGHRTEARAAFGRARAEGSLAGSAPIDLAMLGVSVGDDEAAQIYFREAYKSGALGGRAALDAAYSAKRLGRDADALPYFRLALAPSQAGDPALAPDTLFAARRDVANIERVWGAQTYLGYGKEGASILVPAAQPNATTQAGLEVFRRLGGYHGGHTVEGFARLFETVGSHAQNATDADSLQGWVGVRLRPFEDQKLQIEGSRMIRIGRQARDDWMLRAAYWAGTPGDVRPGGASWWAWSVYLDGARIVQNRETLGVAELRVGRGIALASSGKTSLMPFLGVQTSYDDALARSWATGAGPGISLRSWFRETTDRAPQSFIDLSLQYRARLGGDARGGGLFGVLSVSY